MSGYAKKHGKTSRGRCQGEMPYTQHNNLSCKTLRATFSCVRPKGQRAYGSSSSIVNVHRIIRNVTVTVAWLKSCSARYWLCRQASLSLSRQSESDIKRAGADANKQKTTTGCLVMVDIATSGLINQPIACERSILGRRNSNFHDHPAPAAAAAASAVATICFLAWDVAVIGIRSRARLEER